KPVIKRAARAVGDVAKAAAPVASEAIGTATSKIGNALRQPLVGHSAGEVAEAGGAVAKAATGDAPAAPKLVRGLINPKEEAPYPGIFKHPRKLAQEAAERVEEEHPALYQLFGVRRHELYEIGQQGRRVGNMEPSYYKPEIVRPSYVSERIMTPQNAQRLIDAS